MMFIISGPYQREKAAGCVEMSSVHCIKKEIEQFYIDTDIGTNRSTYVSVCLIDAIFDDYNLIPDQEIFLDNVE